MKVYKLSLPYMSGLQISYWTINFYLGVLISRSGLRCRSRTEKCIVPSVECSSSICLPIKHYACFLGSIFFYSLMLLCWCSFVVHFLVKTFIFFKEWTFVLLSSNILLVIFQIMCCYNMQWVWRLKWTIIVSFLWKWI